MRQFRRIFRAPSRPENSPQFRGCPASPIGLCMIIYKGSDISHNAYIKHGAVFKAIVKESDSDKTLD